LTEKKNQASHLEDTPTGTAIVKDEPRAVASVQAPIDPLSSALLRAIADPDFPLERVEAAYGLIRRREEDQKLKDQEIARIEFDDALARAQATFPIIPERGRIKMHTKENRAAAERSPDPEAFLANKKPMQNTPYPLWEDVVEGITPSLSREGLSLSFKVTTIPAGDAFKIVVRGQLKRRGFMETAETPPLQHDSTGSKNSIQAIKSTTSYGKSMVAGFLTNFASRGENDDGQGGAPIEGAEVISADDLALIKKELAETKTDLDSFLEYIQAESLETMSQQQFRIAIASFGRKREAMAKKVATTT
jgi:hypothetical protein